MKDMTTGEVSGPPLEHDDWTANQRAIERAEADATADKGKPAKPAKSKSHKADDDAK